MGKREKGGIFSFFLFRWLIDNAEASSFPPVQLDSLVSQVVLPDAVREIVRDLIQKKKEGSYLGNFYT